MKIRGRVTKRIYGRVTKRICGRVTKWIYGRVTMVMCGRVTKWIYGRVTFVMCGRVTKSIYDRVTSKICGRVTKWLYGRVTIAMSGRVTNVHKGAGAFFSTLATFSSQVPRSLIPGGCCNEPTIAWIVLGWVRKRKVATARALPSRFDLTNIFIQCWAE
jgi:hypothetical protein